VTEPRRKRGPSEPPIVFLHVPKTAGTTLHAVLVDNVPYGTARSGGNVFRGRGGYDPQRLARRRELERGLRAGDRVVSGHLPYTVKVAFPEDARYVTMLRDPVDRLLSHYHAVSRRRRLKSPGDPLEPETTIDDLIEQHVLFDNLHVRMLSDAEDPAGPVTEDHLRQAKHNLKEFTAFGLVDRFDESLVLLGRRLGLRSLLAPSQRVNVERPGVDEPAVVAAARRHNELDVKLYRYASRLFARAVADEGPDFALDLEALRAARGTDELAVDGVGADDLRSLVVAERARVLRRQQALAHLRARQGLLKRQIGGLEDALAIAEAELERRRSAGAGERGRLARLLVPSEEPPVA
jgi:hypothetical protein